MQSQSSVEISVIIPVYNVEAYLMECLESVSAQDLEPKYSYEVIVVNDGASDNSGVIAREYCDKDERFRYFEQENRGLSGARNRGIEEARGKYICFVDSDDVISRDYLSSLHSAIIEYNVDMAYGDYTESEEEFRAISEWKKEEKECNIECKMEISRREMIDLLAEVGANHSATRLVVAWNKLIKREALGDLRFREQVLHEDEFMIMPLVLSCNKAVMVNKRIYYYRQRNGSIMQDNSEILRHIKVLEAHEERIGLVAGLENGKSSYHKTSCYKVSLEKLKKAYLDSIMIVYLVNMRRLGTRDKAFDRLFRKYMLRALFKYGNIKKIRTNRECMLFLISPWWYAHNRMN